jgi:hypothetical protein
MCIGRPRQRFTTGVSCSSRASAKGGSLELR